MSKRKITVRLHRQHDMDLIRVYLSYPMAFASRMKNALEACVTHKEYTIDVSNKPLKNNGYIKTCICLHLTLDEEEDRALLDALEQVKPRQRNSFIKATTRQCIKTLPLSAYLEGDGLVLSCSASERVTERKRTSKVHTAPSPIRQMEPTTESSIAAMPTFATSELIEEREDEDPFACLDRLAH